MTDTDNTNHPLSAVQFVILAGLQQEEEQSMSEQSKPMYDYFMLDNILLWKTTLTTVYKHRQSNYCTQLKLIRSVMGLL